MSDPDATHAANRIPVPSQTQNEAVYSNYQASALSAEESRIEISSPPLTAHRAAANTDVKSSPPDLKLNARLSALSFWLCSSLLVCLMLV